MPLTASCVQPCAGTTSNRVHTRAFNPASQVIFYDARVRYMADTLHLVDWRATPSADVGARDTRRRQHDNVDSAHNASSRDVGLSSGISSEPRSHDAAYPADGRVPILGSRAAPPRDVLRRLRSHFAPSHPLLSSRNTIVFVSANTATTKPHDMLEDERALVQAISERVASRLPHVKVAVFRGLQVGFERTVELFRTALVVVGRSVPNAVFCGAGTSIVHLSSPEDRPAW